MSATLGKAISLASKCILEERYKSLMRSKPVRDLIHIEVKRFYSGLESRIDKSDLILEAKLFVWLACIQNDPTKDLSRILKYLRTSISNKFISLTRHHTCNSFDVDLEISVEDIDIFPSDHNLEELCLRRDYLNKLYLKAFSLPVINRYRIEKLIEEGV